MIVGRNRGLRLIATKDVAGTTSRERLGTQRAGGRILPMFAAHATASQVFVVQPGHCGDCGVVRSSFGPAAGGLRLLCAEAEGVPAQPPGGPLTCTAAAGCGSAVQDRAAKFAASSACRSRRAPISSRFLAESVSPSRAASANHL